MASANATTRSGRRTVCVKLSWVGVAEIDRLATEDGVDRSTMIRTLLAEAVQARQAGRR